MNYGKNKKAKFKNTLFVVWVYMFVITLATGMLACKHNNDNSPRSIAKNGNETVTKYQKIGNSFVLVK